MGYAKMLKIVRTYRNSQEVIDIAGNFIQRNPEQINKQLISPKHIEDPVLIYTYDGSRKKRDANRRMRIFFISERFVPSNIKFFSYICCYTKLMSL
jgi:DNA helicase-4